MTQQIEKLNTEANKKEYNETQEKWSFCQDLLRSIDLDATNTEIEELEDLLES
jgi:hypothetical protein